jgi:hypothetical protein
MLILAGCGGDDDAAKPKPTATSAEVAADAAAPATGATVRGSGYELHTAEGWSDIKEEIASDSDVILATDSGSILNVLREKVPADAELSVVLAALTRSVLKGADAAKRSPSTPIVVDGAKGVTFRIRIKTDQGQAPGRVVIVVHDGYAYAVAGSSSPQEPSPTDRAFAAMLASWRWT